MQFIWKSNTQNKKDAINDMMNTALEAVVTTRPTVGYLIQVRFSRKQTLKGAIKVSQTQDIEETVLFLLVLRVTYVAIRTNL